VQVAELLLIPLSRTKGPFGGFKGHRYDRPVAGIKENR